MFFKLSFHVVIVAFFIGLVISEKSDGLPFCGQYRENKLPVNLFLVSTLDGHVTALEATSGNKKWSVFTGAPLLSSNIHHLELTSEGQWARLVPSLSGTLYKLAGDSLQPLPLTADNLLSSSYKYSDDLVIAGGRETASFGVDALSGRIMWQCEMRGCMGNDEVTGGNDSSDTDNAELLLLRRTAHTVRALETKSGQERWNFSVGQHDVTMTENDPSGCSNLPSNTEANSDLFSLKVVMPEGLVQAHNPLIPNVLLWQQKLESPITGAWHIKQGKLETINMLRVGSAGAKTKDPGPAHNPHEPSVYIGMYDNQLYIQESASYQEQNSIAVVESNISKQKQLSWHSRPAIEARPKDYLDTSENALAETNNDKDTKYWPTKALQALYASKSAGIAGIFLYETYDDNLCHKDSNIEHTDGDNVTKEFINGHKVKLYEDNIHVTSLWYWWKEVLVIAVSSALLLNLVVTQRVLFRPAVIDPSETIKQEYIVVERHVEVPAPPSKIIDYNASFSSDSSNSGGYSSRYENDFTPLRCLGRGGFGVVFEVKNNIDDCSYAVKRITLPERKSQRDRVLREVRALAKLEHPHIVRYFNAWLEQPPSGWQETKDKDVFKEFNITSQPLHSLYTSTNSITHSQKLAKIQHSGGLKLKKDSHEISMENCFDALKYNFTKETKPTRSRSYSMNDSFSIIFDDLDGPANSSHNGNCSSVENKSGNQPSKNLSSGDDSFIVFANSKRGHAEDSVISIPETEKESHRFKKKRGHRRHWSLDMSTSHSISALNTGRMYLYIQMQLCQPESLHEWLRQNRAPDIRRSQVPSFFNQIVAAVEYVHLAGLIHRDLKPSNILFAPDGSIKVGDFGLVTEMSGKSSNSIQQDPQLSSFRQGNEGNHTHRVGTHLYMSPEQAAGASYNYKVDIFSLGLILFELLFPFSTESERIAAILQLRQGNFPTLFIQEYPMEYELLQLMLSHEPNHRPTAEGVREKSCQLFNCKSTVHMIKHGL